MIKKILLALLILIIVIGLSTFVYIQINKSPQIFQESTAGIYTSQERIVSADTIVKTQQGEVVGFTDNYDTHAWLGIPYASAPVGPLRWKAPQEAKPWGTRFKATEYGSPCVQFWGRVAGGDGQRGDLLGEEDCLHLNVWAPQSRSKSLPVMVWIHGGGNDSGSARIYQGHHLAGTKDVVVVTINYRLGILGWFSHDAVRETSTSPVDASGNYGTLDIIAALQWVQDNIAAFGGDANNVTIFGESAGGRNVYSMLASPLAKGLFHKAIVQSGTAETTPLIQAEDYPDAAPKRAISGLRNSSSALIEMVARKQAPDLSHTDLRASIDTMSASEVMHMMRSTEPYELMRLLTENSGQLGYIQVANVLQDGIVIPKTTTMELLSRPGSYNQVPLMLGTTRDEQKVFMSADPKYVDMRLGLFPKVKDQLWYDLVSDYVSKMWKAASVDEPAKRILAAGGPEVYAFRFDWDDSPSNFLIDIKGLLGATHGMEINYVFGDFIGGLPYQPVYSKDNADGRKALALSMMDYWAGFAHSGSPAKGYSGEQVEWSAWQASGSNVMLLDAPDSGGTRMENVRDNVSDIKQRIAADTVMVQQKDRCWAFASLFLHGYQADDFWDPQEYADLGCQAYPAGEFRER